MNLLAKLLARLVVGLLTCAALLFIPAGSLRYWQGWIFLAVFFIPAISFSFYLYKHDPQLLERRLQMKITEQGLLVTLVKAFSLGGFVLSSLDYRFGWSHHFLGPAPLWLKVLSPALVLAGVLLMLLGLCRQQFRLANRYLDEDCPDHSMRQFFRQKKYRFDLSCYRRNPVHSHEYRGS
jgi:hypothetical protein